VTRAAAGAAALVLAALLATGCGGDDPKKRPERVLGAEAAPPRAAPPPPPAGLLDHVPGRGTVTAYVTADKVLRRRPGGRRIAPLPKRTTFGSVRVLPVVERRGDWVRVLAPELANGQRGWIDGRHDVSLYRTDWSLTASVSRRLLVVRHRGRIVRRVPVAVGRPGAPTPRGRYGVTDKLTTGSDGGPYGCCVLALSGHQPHIPQGWGGGDRVAIHATPAPETIGQAASLGCLRATNAVMRRLVRQVPLGTVLRIRD
jgi:lipoprotein-anchoring transpeptidase ErfK/SrfK